MGLEEADTSSSTLKREEGRWPVLSHLPEPLPRKPEMKAVKQSLGARGGARPDKGSVGQDYQRWKAGQTRPLVEEGSTSAKGTEDP